MKLKNKVVLITGASRGIGRATALAFAKEGSHIVINYLRQIAKANSLAKQIEKIGAKTLVIQADVADPKQFKLMVAKAIKKFKAIDILVNNAGLIIQTDQDWQKITDKVWNRTMDVNLKSVFNGIKSVAPIMQKQKQGRVINLASVFGQTGAAPVVAYTTAKAGIESLTKAMAKQLAPNITVNSVAPAVCQTDMTKDSGPQVIKWLTDNTPLKRIAKPKEIAEAIVFLAKSDFITGQTLNVDGGYSLK